MRERNRFTFLIWVFMAMLHLNTIHAEQQRSESHIEVALRMIGHQLLLASGDDTSRVMPVKRELGTYRISFEHDLAIIPDTLKGVVERIVGQAKIASAYVVQVERCDSAQVVYAFEVGVSNESTIVPCVGRNLPQACYEVLLTITTPISTSEEASKGSTNWANWLYIVVIVSCLMPVFVVVYFSRKKKARKNPNLIVLGKYHFDKIRSELIIAEQRIELTSKEADLLFLLYETLNNTVEREVLLNKVWGDEGDYIGRTLDVFISKLRKKLEFDERIKIVNVRGVGYKLVMDV